MPDYVTRRPVADRAEPTLMLTAFRYQKERNNDSGSTDIRLRELRIGIYCLYALMSSLMLSVADHRAQRHRLC